MVPSAAKNGVFFALLITLSLTLSEIMLSLFQSYLNRISIK